MKTKINIYLSISVVSIFLVITTTKLITEDKPRHTFESGKSPAPESTLKYQTSQKKDIELNSMNSMIETAKEKFSANEETNYQILGHENIHLDLDRKTLMDRIENGIASMEIVEFRVYPDSEVLVIEKAYERLIGSLPFIDGKFPIWGVDRDSYFVFSGRPGMNLDLAFKYGYAIKKENGRIYRWFSPQDK